MKRSSGILLHISSLPGKHGIGDFGPAAFRWLDFLADAKQRYWQILPLGPTGYGNSPYSSSSAFAGNPLLIDLDQLVADELLTAADFEPYDNDPQRVRFEKVRRYKLQHLNKAYVNFKRRADWQAQLDAFGAKQSWLKPYAAYAAAKGECDPDFIRFEQMIFSRQLEKLRAHAKARDVRIIGDLPMYVAPDSAERVAMPEVFDLDSGFVAGAPPCGTFPTGQKWGNPLFRWDRLRENGYRWWIDRLKALLQQVDVVRLDYFCGYCCYWATNGHIGHWRRGPENDLFEKMAYELGRLDLIAEDLGEVTPDIHNLRDRHSILSTKVLQYGFDGMNENPYHPDNFKNTNCVVYTGTHDNDTTRGWYETAPEHVKANVRSTCGSDGRDAPWDLIKLAARSKADLMIVQYQDVLCLGRESRFNTPGTVTNQNWSWRITDEQMHPETAKALAWLATQNGRAEY